MKLRPASSRLAALVALLLVGIAACGGSSKPQARVSTSSSSTTTSTIPVPVTDPAAAGFVLAPNGTALIGDQVNHRFVRVDDTGGGAGLVRYRLDA